MFCSSRKGEQKIKGNLAITGGKPMQMETRTTSVDFVHGVRKVIIRKKMTEADVLAHALYLERIGKVAEADRLLDRFIYLTKVRQ